MSCIIGQRNPIATQYEKLIHEKGMPGGIVYIKHKGKVVLHRAFGYSDIENKIKMELDDRFRIFSMSKPITALATIKVMEENNIDFDQTIQEIYPKYEASYPVSIRNLLRHTAGYTYGGQFNWTGLNYWIYDPLEKSKDLKEFMSRLSGLPLSYKPGEEWEYSIASDVQGALIEEISGLKFEKYMKDFFFSTLGMTDSGFVKKDKEDKPLVPFYKYDSEQDTFIKLEIPSKYDKHIASGGGGMYCSVGDFAKFLDILLEPQNCEGFLDSRLVKEMMKNQLPTSIPSIDSQIYPDSGYGYGVAVKLVDDTIPKNTVFWAGLGGTIFWVDPKDELGVIVMTQIAGGRKSIENYFTKWVYDWLEQQPFN